MTTRDNDETNGTAFSEYSADSLQSTAIPEQFKIRIGPSDDAKIFIGDPDAPQPILQAEDMRLAVQVKARHARDVFKIARESPDTDQAESSYYSARDSVEELWNYVNVRGRAFQDLLGLIDAAIKHRALSDFDDTQRDAISLAFADLPKLFIDEIEVEQHLRRFAEQQIDITAPLTPMDAKKFRVVVEEIS